MLQECLRLKTYAVSLLISVILAGCAVGPNFHSPAAPNTQRYTASCLPEHTTSAKSPGGQAQHFVACQDIPAQWWLLFHSQELNYLICRGISNSPTLDAAQAALRQAKDNLSAVIGSTLFPVVGLQASVERERFSAATFGASGAGGSGSTTSGISTTSLFNLYNTAVNVSYTPDVFGGARRQIEASRSLVDYQCFELEATYLTLTSNIVTTAVTVASLCAQIQATHELINAQENELQIVRKQFHLGGVSRVDVLTQETQVAQLLATLPPLEKSLAQNRHALAVLVGGLPSETCLPEITLDCLDLPTDLPISIPSLLVRQRPDIRASEAQLHEASAQIGVATANLFPQFTITGSYGSEANLIKDLFTPSAKVWDIIGQVSQPIFQGGSLLAKRRAAIDAYCQAYAQYRQTVLQGFQNVADALRAIQIDADELKAQAAAEIAARETVVLTRKQFHLGGVSYLSLLTAERQYQQARVNRIQAQAARYTDTAALFQALGGGWWNRGGHIPCQCGTKL